MCWLEEIYTRLKWDHHSQLTLSPRYT